MKKILLAFMILLLVGCAPVATDLPNMDEPVNSDTPLPPTISAPLDSNQPRENVYLDSTELLTMESYPLQFSLMLKGNLPTPCHQLHIEMTPPDAQNKIAVDVYSTSQPDMMCAEVLQPFEENFPLGSFPAGHYILWVNGKQVVEFDA